MALLNPEGKQSETEFGGRARPIPGKYHVAVNSCEQKNEPGKKPQIVVDFQVIADGQARGADGKTFVTTSDQIGRGIMAYMSLLSDDPSKTPTCLAQIARFAMCVGVLAPGEQKDTDDIDWSEALGRELIIEVKAKKDDANKVEVPFMGFWSLGNSQVASVPKDPQSPGMLQLAKAGGPVKRPDAAPKANGSAAAAPAAAAEAVAAGAGASAWDNL